MRTTRTLKAVLATTTALVFTASFIPAANGQSSQPTTCRGLTVTVDLAAGQSPTDGDDVIQGTAADDTIAAGDGDDVICGNGGDDRIWGQEGRDIILGGDGDDRLRGGPGHDLLEGQAGADDIAGGPDHDRILGGDGDDTVLRGGTGHDTVDGGEGNDALVAGNGGNDRVLGGPGDDKVTGGPRLDRLLGGPGNDELRGHKGADRILGEAGDDELYGGAQSDYLDGGEGFDLCNGGTTGDTELEDDLAAHCEERINIESAEIGTARVGGDFADGVSWPFELEILESDPEQLVLSFQAAPEPCLGARAVVTGFDDYVRVILWVGQPTLDPGTVCPAVLVDHQLTVELTEGLDGRDVRGRVTGRVIGTGSLGGEPFGDPLRIPFDVTVVETDPEKLIIDFLAGVEACTAATATVTGFTDHVAVELLLQSPVGGPDVCPLPLLPYQIVVDLTERLNGREIRVPSNATCCG